MMDIPLPGLSTQVAMASIALIGYLVGRRRREQMSEPTKAAAHQQKSPFDQSADEVIAEVESISDRLRRSMAEHHLTVCRCREQIESIGEKHGGDPSCERPRWEDLLAPTQTLSEDIAHAYDELRRHAAALQRHGKKRSTDTCGRLHQSGSHQKLVKQPASPKHRGANP